MMDPITVAVIGSALRAIVGEMGDSLRRSAHSPIIREMLDYSCAAFTAEGDVAAEDANIPALLGSMAMAMPMMLRENPPATVNAGDIFIGNDPYRGCTHTPDIHLFSPVFAAGQLIGWVGNLAHHADIGGTNPGTEGFANRSIFEEGLRFPWIKLFDAHQPNQALLRYIENNTRDPRASMGDLRAQIAANRLGVRRMTGLIDKYGAVVTTAAMRERQAMGERRVRNLLSSAPDGRGHAVGHLDDDGIGSAPVRIEAAVEVKGDRIRMDFTGSADQMPGGMNCSRTAAIAAAMFVVRAAFDPDGDQTGGCARPIEIVLPEGSVVNPRYPAAVSLRHLAVQRMTDTLIRALAEFMPNVRTAGSFVGFSSLAAECRHPRTQRPVVMSDDLGGGMGGNADCDGLSAVDPYLGNINILPMEICEQQYPIRILTTELVPNTGGAGHHRGGLGLRRVYEFLDTCDVVFYTEQTKTEFAPWGAAGGKPGRPASLVLERADGEVRAIRKDRLLVHRGDRLTATTAGGGGWGEPGLRPDSAIAKDVREGKVTADAARRDYGFAEPSHASCRSPGEQCR